MTLSIIKNEILEKADKMGVKVSGLDGVPYIVQGRPLFDFVGVDPAVLNSLGQNEEDLFQAAGKFNIAVFPDGRVEGLKTVSGQYNLVQHLDAINISMNHVPENFQLERVDVMTSMDGARIWAKFFSRQQVEIKKGDLVQVVSTIQNSCDTSKVYRMVAQAMRLICTNGMTMPDSRFNGATVKKLHKGGLNVDNQVKGFFSNIDESIAAINGWKKYTEKEVKQEQIESIFEALGEGPKVQEEIMSQTLRGEDTSVGTLLENKNLTAWDLYNSFTQRITDSDSSEAVKIEKGIKVAAVLDEFVEAV